MAAQDEVNQYLGPVQPRELMHEPQRDPREQLVGGIGRRRLFRCGVAPTDAYCESQALAL
jgi:hypothetical protein